MPEANFKSDHFERPRYACPERHEWEDRSEVSAPLVNIKCPHCGKTAMRFYRGRAASQWTVQPLRTLHADIPPRSAAGCTCGTPPFAPPEPSSDCPFHGSVETDEEQA